jgi:glutamate 5-kinase
MRNRLRKAHRVVVKVGTGVLTDSNGRLDPRILEQLAADFAAVARTHELVVVSSGAIALGVERLGLRSRPTDMPGKQAAAAVGQSRLMARYDQALAAMGVVVAQVLLTHEDLASRKRYFNARRTLLRLLESKVLPIINENDTVSVDEIKFGDNDALAALVVGLVGADALIILSDVRGLYDDDPRRTATATLIHEVPKITAEIDRLARGSTSGRGTGGMSTKLRAARRASQAGAVTLIAEGKAPGILEAALSGEPVGTVFGVEEKRLKGVRRFLAHAAAPRGELRVDDGARRAISDGGKSLLPAGVKAVRGSFGIGDPVDIADARGRAFARGVVGYSADEVRKIMGRRTSEIAAILGYKYLDEIVRRDDLVLL